MIIGNGGVDLKTSNLNITGTGGSTIAFGGGGTVLYAAGGYIKQDGSTPLTGNWNIGAFTITTTQTATTANTAYDGFVLSNTTAASSGNQQYSSSIHFIGQGFGGSTSQTVEIRNLLVPVQGGTNPSAQFTMDAKINGGSWTNMMMLSTSGGLSIAAGSASPSFLIGNSGSATYQFYTSGFVATVPITSKGGTTTNPGFNGGDSGRSGISPSDGSTTSSVSFITNNTERGRIFHSGGFVYGDSTEVTTAILALVSTTKGFLAPVMTTTQRNAIASPVTGLEVNDSTINGLFRYDGSSWIQL